MNSIKNKEQYEALLDQGMSKQKAARIANANSKKEGKKGGKGEKYEERTKEELYNKAKDIGLDVNKNMKKDEIIHELRNH